MRHAQRRKEGVVFLSLSLNGAKAEHFISTYHASQECLAAVSSAAVWRATQLDILLTVSAERRRETERETDRERARQREKRIHIEDTSQTDRILDRRTDNVC